MYRYCKFVVYIDLLIVDNFVPQYIAAICRNNIYAQAAVIRAQSGEGADKYDK